MALEPVTRGFFGCSWTRRGYQPEGKSSGGRVSQRPHRTFLGRGPQLRRALRDRRHRPPRHPDRRSRRGRADAALDGTSSCIAAPTDERSPSRETWHSTGGDPKGRPRAIRSSPFYSQSVTALPSPTGHYPDWTPDKRPFRAFSRGISCTPGPLGLREFRFDLGL